MKNINHKKTKNINIISFIIITILILIIVMFLVTNKIISPIISQETITFQNYTYCLPNNPTNYQKQLFLNLTNILSQDNIDEENYATTLAQIFLTDLFTLDNKTNSSDIPSSQYIYTNYQEDYQNLIKNTLYSNIIVNNDNNRNQILPIVTNVEIISINQDEYLYQEEILDTQAYYITARITYQKELNYPTKYNLIIANNNDILQVVQAKEQEEID